MKKIIFLTFGILIISFYGFSQNIWILNNGDPDYTNPPFDDSLKLFQADGTKLMAKSGFNTCQAISAIRQLAVTTDGEECWVAEYGGKKISKIDNNGNAIKEININRYINGIDLISNGNLYVLGANNYGIADSVYIFDTSGNIILSAPYGGWDIAVDEENNSVWIVGDDIKKLDLNLNHEFTIDPITWSATSVDFSSDGSVWVGEGKHSNVTGSKDRLLHISNSGIIIDSINLTYRPTCIRLNRKDGYIWVASFHLYSINPATLVMEQIPNSYAFSITIDSQEDVWAASSSDVQKFSKSGNLLLTINNFAGYDQKHIATTKIYSNPSSIPIQDWAIYFTLLLIFSFLLIIAFKSKYLL